MNDLLNPYGPPVLDACAQVETENGHTENAALLTGIAWALRKLQREAPGGAVPSEAAIEAALVASSADHVPPIVWPTDYTRGGELEHRRHMEAALRAAYAIDGLRGQPAPPEGPWIAALQWALDHIADGDDGTPQHRCEFITNPPKGACDFHERYWGARDMLKSSGNTPPEVSAQSNPPVTKP